MLRQDDLDIAVGRGIITPEQADELVAVASERHRKRAFAVGREERFRLLGGFNDFFIAVGVVLLACGLGYGMTLVSVPSYQGGVARYPDPTLKLSVAALTMLAYWALAEWLTGRLKLTAPSIVLAVAFVLSAASAFGVWAGALLGSSTTTMSAEIGALLAALMHYLRFRLPFTLLPLAVSMFVLLAAMALAIAGSPVSTTGTAIQTLRWTALAMGLATFALAMRFDLSDPERLSRRADCGFWLHLAAAPMIVHPLASPLIDHPLFGGVRGAVAELGPDTVAAVVGLTVVLALVALAIDRRALLVAGMGYLGAAIAYGISRTGVAANVAAVATLVFLGLTIILLGTGWRPLRAALMSSLPHFPLKSSLPPYIGS